MNTRCLAVKYLTYNDEITFELTIEMQVVYPYGFFHEYATASIDCTAMMSYKDFTNICLYLTTPCVSREAVRYELRVLLGLVSSSDTCVRWVDHCRLTPAVPYCCRSYAEYRSISAQNFESYTPFQLVVSQNVVVCAFGWNCYPLGNRLALLEPVVARYELLKELLPPPSIVTKKLRSIARDYYSPPSHRRGMKSFACLLSNRVAPRPPKGCNSSSYDLIDSSLRLQLGRELQNVINPPITTKYEEYGIVFGYTRL